MLQFGHARGALRRVGPEDLLVVDPAPAQPRQRLERRSGAPRVGHAGDAGGPCVAHPLLRRARKLLRSRRVLEGAQRADPRRELALRVLAGEMGQLEVGMRVDETGKEAGVWKFELSCPGRVGTTRFGPTAAMVPRSSTRTAP